MERKKKERKKKEIEVDNLHSNKVEKILK
jgi:hypothetical protein